MSEIPVISGSSTTVLCVQVVVLERKHSAGYMNFDNADWNHLCNYLKHKFGAYDAAYVSDEYFDPYDLL